MDYFVHPENVVRVMRPQITNLKIAISHHYKNRRDGRGNEAVRNWIKELRRIDRGSGYSIAIQQIRERGEK